MGVRSVIFTLNRAHYRTENSAPYALAGDSGGDYNAWNYIPGMYTITATAYEWGNGLGNVIATASITINIVDQPTQPTIVPPTEIPNTIPTAQDDVATTDKDTSVNIAVLDNDHDSDGDMLSIVTITNPANGTTTLNADNIVAYMPNPGFVGTDMFIYSISDGKGGEASARVLVTVEDVIENQAPVIQDINNRQDDEGAEISLQVVANDPENGALRYNAANLPTGLSIDDTTGAITGVIAGNAANNSPYTVLVTVIDDAGEKAETTFRWMIHETVDEVLTIETFTLVNADNDEDIMILTDQMRLNLASLPTRNLNIRADVMGSVGSVVFSWDNQHQQTENNAPYTFAGDTAGDYEAWTPDLGVHTLLAVPYRAGNGNGMMGRTVRDFIRDCRCR